MAKRKMKRERMVYSLYDFDGTLKDVRKFIDGLIEEYGEGATLSPDTEWDYDGDRSIFELYYEREETDAEMNKRLEAARKQRERRKVQKAKEAVEREARERKELARLKEKYGEG
jgi:hypothetical protein